MLYNRQEAIYRQRAVLEVYYVQFHKLDSVLHEHLECTRQLVSGLQETTTVIDAMALRVVDPQVTMAIQRYTGFVETQLNAVEPVCRSLLASIAVVNSLVKSIDALATAFIALWRKAEFESAVAEQTSGAQHPDVSSALRQDVTNSYQIITTARSRAAETRQALRDVVDSCTAGSVHGAD
jgi:hypothetical protein